MNLLNSNDLTPQTYALRESLSSIGIDLAPATGFDMAYGYIGFKGPRTGFLYRLRLEELEAIKDVAYWRDCRETCLIKLGFLNTPGDWYHDSDREDDGDAYQYDHYAVNRVTGQRVYLDVGFSISSLSHDEFRLHVATGFPRRSEIGDGGPIRNGRLEAHVFKRCDG